MHCDAQPQSRWDTYLKLLHSGPSQRKLHQGCTVKHMVADKKINKLCYCISKLSWSIKQTCLECSIIPVFLFLFTFEKWMFERFLLWYFFLQSSCLYKSVLLYWNGVSKSRSNKRKKKTHNNNIHIILWKQKPRKVVNVGNIVSNISSQTILVLHLCLAKTIYYKKNEKVKKNI